MVSCRAHPSYFLLKFKNLSKHFTGNKVSPDCTDSQQCFWTIFPAMTNAVTDGPDLLRWVNNCCLDVRGQHHFTRSLVMFAAVSSYIVVGSDSGTEQKLDVHAMNLYTLQLSYHNTEHILSSLSSRLRRWPTTCCMQGKSITHCKENRDGTNPAYSIK